MNTRFKIQLQLKMFITSVILITSLVVIAVEILPIPSDTLTLPPPDLKGHLPLSTAIHQTRITRDLTTHDLDITDISQLLWAFQGITHGPSFRSAPSAGATYPLKIFLLKRTNTQLDKGIYSYSAYDHSLKPISHSYLESQILNSLSIEDREILSNVDIIFFILADYARTTDRYGARGIQYVHLEAGHAIQNFLLEVTSLNLNTWVIPDFNDQNIQLFFNTTLQPLVILPVGVHTSTNQILRRLKENHLTKHNEMTVEEAIAKRKSVREYIDGNIPLETISELLFDSIDINYLRGNESYLDLRIVVGEVEELLPGLYQYNLTNHSLVQYTENDSRSPLMLAAINQPWVESAQVNLVISLDTFWTNQQPDSDHYHRIFMHIIGMIAQNIYLKCVDLGLGTVVIGAFHEWAVSQLLELQNSFTPIYIIPIGLTPKFFEEKTQTLFPLTEIARFLGLTSFIFFFTSLYLTLPAIRRRITKRIYNWLHCISGFVPIFGITIHYLLIHGHMTTIWAFFSLNSYINALLFFIQTIFSVPQTRDELGKLLASYALFFGIITASIGIILAFRLVKKRKILRSIHKYAIFITISLAIIHNLLNGTYFATRPWLFLSLNILAFDIYFLVGYLANLAKLSRKHRIFTTEPFPP